MKSAAKLVLPFVLFTLMSVDQSYAQWVFDTAIATGTNTSGIALSADGKRLVVTNNTNPGSVSIVSTSTYSVSTVDISSAENYPNGVVIAPNDSVALVATTHKIVSVNLFSHTITGSFSAPCVGTTLYGISVTQNSQTAVFPDLSSDCSQQGLRLFDATGHVAGSTFIPVNTSGELYGIALTPDGGSALVTTFTSDSPKLVNLSTSGVQSIAGMSGSYGVAMLHNGVDALVFDGDSLDRVSLTTRSITKKIAPLSYNTSFQNIAITSDDKYAFVVGAFEKLIIALANDSVVQTFTAGGTNVATSPDGSTFYVTDSYNGAVRVYKRQGTSGVVDVQAKVPASYALQQNYPNPFNPTTTIAYALPHESHVLLAIYDGLGRKVLTLVDDDKAAGKYHVTFDAAGLSSGTYFYRLQAGGFGETKKLVLLK
jgi:DNA-binding beta-propeller fold protein YncE